MVDAGKSGVSIIIIRLYVVMKPTQAASCRKQARDLADGGTKKILVGTVNSVRAGPSCD